MNCNKLASLRQLQPNGEPYPKLNHVGQLYDWTFPSPYVSGVSCIDCHGLTNRADAKFFLGPFQMGNDRPATDAEQLSRVACRLPAHSPLQAFYFSSAQMNALDLATGYDEIPDIGVKVIGDELKDRVPARTSCRTKGAFFTGDSRECGRPAPPKWNRHRQTASNSESRRLIEECSGLRIELSNMWSPNKWFLANLGALDDRINVVVSVLEIVADPALIICRNQQWTLGLRIIDEGKIGKCVEAHCQYDGTEGVSQMIETCGAFAAIEIVLDS